MKKSQIILLLLVTFFSINISAGISAQADTVKAPDISNVPVIDGIADDECWNNVEWQSIDQVWMPYDVFIDSSDFYGHYKVLWSSSTNLLYFLVEVHDDIWVDGYEFTGDNDSYNYDIIEVFIDQDKSGGLHIFDGTPSSGLGVNAENAFSYHINVSLGNEGGPSTTYDVLDFDGTSWGNNRIMNYAPHFPELVLRENEGKYYWEFSLKVYNDTYDDNDPEASRVTLMEGDIMGLSLAYCDNDDPNEFPKQRDNFFGSVHVEHEDSNSHWMNADDYGTIILTDEVTDVADDIQSVSSSNELNVYPNPSNGILRYRLNNNASGKVSIKVYNILGQKVLDINHSKSSGEISKMLQLNNLPSGIYILSAEINHQVVTKRISIFRD